MFADFVFDTLDTICLTNNAAFKKESSRFNPRCKYSLDCWDGENGDIVFGVCPSALSGLGDFEDGWFTIRLDDSIKPTPAGLAVAAEAIRAHTATGDEDIHDFVERLVAGGCERTAALAAGRTVRTALKVVADCISTTLEQSGDKEDA